MSDQRNWRDGASALAARGDDVKDEASAFGAASVTAPDIFPDAASAPARSATAPSQIVFIEGSVADSQILAEGVQPGVKAVILNPDANGVHQIADYLRQHDIQNLDAICIVADGADGELQLGNTLLSASNVAAYRPQLAEIGAALEPGGSLMIYGCDVAQNSTGVAFLGDLAAATGVANIAAASHVVGAATDGGSFNLDVDLGAAAGATGPFTAATVAAYPDLLDIASNLVWYAANFNSTEDTGVYTVDVNGGAEATNPADIKSTPSYAFGIINGLAIDPADGHYFVSNEIGEVVGGNPEDVNTIVEGNISGSGTPSVIYTPGNGGQDAMEGLTFDPLNGLLYFAVTDANIPGSNTDTGIYTINALGSGAQTATDLVNLSSGVHSPTDIAIDSTHNLLFYTNGVPGLTNVEEVGVANLTTGAIINGDLVNYESSNGGDQEPYGIAVDPATDTLYWTTVNFSANAGNAVYSATYTTGASVTLSNTQTLGAASQAQAPIGIALDVPAGGYYVDTSTGIPDDTTPNEVLFGSSLTQPETLTSVYAVPRADAETVQTSAIVVETQPTVAASGTVTYVEGAAAITIDSGATVSDADGDNLASATVSIASGMGAGDTLSFTDQNGITGSYSFGTLTLTGVATVTNYQVALDNVTFSTSSASATPRTIDWTVSDGVVTSPTASSTVDVLHCYFHGTRIATPHGEVAVETLERGDLVLTCEGRAVPVAWLGVQTVSRRFADPLRVLPIRIKSGALAENVPSRDLLISPDHAIRIDHALFQAGALVNGSSITRETDVPDVFAYYHIETENHELILADNTPAETFIDNVDRLAFDNWAEHEALYPDGKEMEELPYPRAKSHRQVPMDIRARLAKRAQIIGAVAIARIA